MKIIIIIFCMSVFAPLLSKAGNHEFSFSINYGFINEGSIQVRENDVLGENLNLKEDLGLNLLASASLGYGYQLANGWLDLNYTKFFIRGSAEMQRSFNFNGAIYSPGQTNLNKTDYRKISILYKKVISGQKGSLNRFIFGGGILIETLKFYINGALDPSSTRFEKFEAFDRQTFPVPAVYFDWTTEIKNGFGYGLDFTGCYLPKTKTPYSESGRIYFEQSNADLKGQLIWSFKNVLLSGGLQYKYFRQREYSTEDTNKFKIHSTQVFLDFKWLP